MEKSFCFTKPFQPGCTLTNILWSTWMNVIHCSFYFNDQIFLRLKVVAVQKAFNCSSIQANTIGNGVRWESIGRSSDDLLQSPALDHHIITISWPSEIKAEDTGNTLHIRQSIHLVCCLCPLEVVRLFIQCQVINRNWNIDDIKRLRRHWKDETKI